MSGDHKFRGRPVLNIRWNRIKRVVRETDSRKECTFQSVTSSQSSRLGTLQTKNAHGQATSKRIFLPGRFPGATRYDRWSDVPALEQSEQDDPDSH